MSQNKLRSLRIMKQLKDLDKNPLQNAIIRLQGNLNFHFCLYNLQDDFNGGFYHGLLQLHENYPFSPPKLIIYTPNGRYQINTPICTSFTNYHPESWQPIWNVKSLIQATISFMYANQDSYGCIKDTSQIRKKMAKESLQWNFRNQKFQELFKETINEKFPQLAKRAIKRSKLKVDKNILNINNNQIINQNLEMFDAVGQNLQIDERALIKIQPAKNNLKIYPNNNNNPNYNQKKIIIVGVICGYLIYRGAKWYKLF